MTSMTSLVRTKEFYDQCIEKSVSGSSDTALAKKSFLRAYFSEYASYEGEDPKIHQAVLSKLAATHARALSKPEFEELAEEASKLRTFCISDVLFPPRRGGK